jgi:hypothetical protein
LIAILACKISHSCLFFGDAEGEGLTDGETDAEGGVEGLDVAKTGGVGRLLGLFEGGNEGINVGGRGRKVGRNDGIGGTHIGGKQAMSDGLGEGDSLGEGEGEGDSDGLGDGEGGAGTTSTSR